MPKRMPAAWCNTHAAVERVVHFYETLSLDRLADLGTCYAPHAHFTDPFNDVCGLEDIARVFDHMFETLETPKFEVTRRLVQGQEAVLGWKFHFRVRRWPRLPSQCVAGVSWLQFDGEGRVIRHQDHWDAAQGLYEAFPVLGALMRWLRRGASATAGRKAR